MRLRRWSDPTKYKGITEKVQIDTLGYINTLGSGAQLMIAATFGCACVVACPGMWACGTCH